MAHIILRDVEQDYTLRLDELQRIPNSLLASMAKTSSTADGPKDSPPAEPQSKKKGLEHAVDGAYKAVVLDLSGMPDSPLKNWPSAAVVTQSMYRYGHILPEILASILKGIVGKLPSHYKVIHEQLSELLSYLDLPCPVSRWLPPLESIRLQHLNVLTFCSSCKELDHDYGLKMAAQQAVATMLSCQPYRQPSAGSGSADLRSLIDGYRFWLFAVIARGQPALQTELEVSAMSVYAAQHRHNVFDWCKARLDSLDECSRNSPWRASKHNTAFDVSHRSEPLQIFLGEYKSLELLQFAPILAGGGVGPPVSIRDMNLKAFVGRREPGCKYDAPELVAHLGKAFHSLTAGSALSLCEVRGSVKSSSQKVAWGVQVQQVENVALWLVRW